MARAPSCCTSIELCYAKHTEQWLCICSLLCLERSKDVVVARHDGEGAVVTTAAPKHNPIVWQLDGKGAVVTTAAAKHNLVVGHVKKTKP